MARLFQLNWARARNGAHYGHRVGGPHLRRQEAEACCDRRLADDQIAQVGELRTDSGDGLERDVMTFPRIEPGDSKQHLLVLQGEAPDKILARAARGKPLAIHTRGNLADAGFRDSDPKQLLLGESASCDHGIGLVIDAVANQMLVSPLIHLGDLSAMAVRDVGDSETMLQHEPNHSLRIKVTRMNQIDLIFADKTDGFRQGEDNLEELTILQVRKGVEPADDLQQYA